MVRKLLLTAAALLLVGCASAPPRANVGTGGGVPGMDAANAQATLQAAQLAEAATVQVAAQQTAVAAQATGEARAQQTAVAEEATRQAVATREALQVQQTAVAMQMAVDDATRRAVATETAVSVTIAAEEAREVQRTENTVMLRAAEAARMERDLFWRQVNQGLYAAVIAALILALLAFSGSIVSRVRFLNRDPVRSYPDGSGVNILVMPQGLFGMEARQIGAPVRRSLPAGNGAPPLLSSGAEPAADLPSIPEGHVLIAGPSGSGKSTAMRALLRDRRNVVVLDPHAAPGEWGAVDVKTDYDAIEQFMGEMIDLLYERKEARNAGARLEFDPITVATDEMPAIVDELGRDVATGAWKAWVRQGRKFGLFVIVSSQSTRVRTLGIAGEGDLRDQFTAVLYLGSEAEVNFADLVAGQSRPAVVEIAGQPARAVAVPHVPAFPNGNPADNDLWSRAAAASGADIVDGARRTAVTVPPPGLDTEYGFIPQNEVDAIMHYAARGKSIRGVSERVYGATGGVGFYKARAVLDHFGRLP